MKRILIGVSVLLMVSLSFLGGMEYSNVAMSTNSDQLARFEEVYNLLRDHHIFYSTDEKLIDGAIDGMIASLDDPHTSYFNYQESQAFSQGLSSSYVGVGIGVHYFNKEFLITEIAADSPADYAGLRINDKIVEVDGTNIQGMEFYDGVSLIMGEAGDDVTLGIQRDGVAGILYFTMTRTVLTNVTVKYQMIDEEHKVGYIQILGFGADTQQEFMNALTDLEGQNISNLIIDLRDNGGGYLTTVTSMLNNLLTGDRPYLYIEDEDSTQTYLGSLEQPKPYNIVAIVNENTASAAEVFAAALKEYGGYDVVGVTTYGKGTMQVDKTIFHSDGDKLHISVGKWYTPDHNWVNGVGVEPTVVVEQPYYFNAQQIILNDTDTLQYDMVSSNVANLQVILTGLDYYSGRTDGYFDDDTKTAVEQFQADNLLPINGIVDHDTANALDQAMFNKVNDPANDEQLNEALSLLIQ